MADPLDRADEPSLARPGSRPSWRDRLEHLADATGSSPARLVTGGLAVALLAAVGLWLTRPPAPPPETSLPFTSTSVLGTGPGAAVVTSTTPPAELVVHVAGAVVLPGVHRVAVGARVIDAVAAAGGLAAQADGARINLAAPVVDGERIYVPAVGEAAPPSVGGAAGAGGGAGEPAGPVNLNTASEAQLDALPGVGPATATAIVAHRERIGGFTSVDQLLDVRGIGEAKLEALRPLVTV